MNSELSSADDLEKKREEGEPERAGELEQSWRETEQRSRGNGASSKAGLRGDGGTNTKEEKISRAWEGFWGKRRANRELLSQDPCTVDSPTRAKDEITEVGKCLISSTQIEEISERMIYSVTRFLLQLLQATNTRTGMGA
jgi:hypothetical protein